MHSHPESLPPKPEPPKDYDCCGGGCADCELRRYYQSLALWQRLAASIPAATAENEAENAKPDLVSIAGGFYP